MINEPDSRLPLIFNLLRAKRVFVSEPLRPHLPVSNLGTLIRGLVALYFSRLKIPIVTGTGTMTLSCDIQHSLDVCGDRPRAVFHHRKQTT